MNGWKLVLAGVGLFVLAVVVGGLVGEAIGGDNGRAVSALLGFAGGVPAGSMILSGLFNRGDR